MATASSGIDATLLTRGHTLHSTFKIPLDLHAMDIPIDTSPDVIQIPENIGTFVCSMEELVFKVYPDLLSNFRNMAWLSEQCILMKPCTMLLTLPC